MPIDIIFKLALYIYTTPDLFASIIMIDLTLLFFTIVILSCGCEKSDGDVDWPNRCNLYFCIIVYLLVFCGYYLYTYKPHFIFWFIYIFIASIHAAVWSIEVDSRLPYYSRMWPNRPDWFF